MPKITHFSHKKRVLGNFFEKTRKKFPKYLVDSQKLRTFAIA